MYACMFEPGNCWAGCVCSLLLLVHCRDCHLIVVNSLRQSQHRHADRQHIMFCPSGTHADSAISYQMHLYCHLRLLGSTCHPLWWLFVLAPQARGVLFVGPSCRRVFSRKKCGALCCHAGCARHIFLHQMDELFHKELHHLHAELLVEEFFSLSSFSC
jgi:hypothetical protein